MTANVLITPQTTWQLLAVAEHLRRFRPCSVMLLFPWEAQRTHCCASLPHTLFMFWHFPLSGSFFSSINSMVQFSSFQEQISVFFSSFSLKPSSSCRRALGSSEREKWLFMGPNPSRYMLLSDFSRYFYSFSLQPWMCSDSSLP